AVARARCRAGRRVPRQRRSQGRARAACLALQGALKAATVRGRRAGTIQSGKPKEMLSTWSGATHMGGRPASAGRPGQRALSSVARCCLYRLRTDQLWLREIAVLEEGAANTDGMSTMPAMPTRT